MATQGAGGALAGGALFPATSCTAAPPPPAARAAAREGGAPPPGSKRKSSGAARAGGAQPALLPQPQQGTWSIKQWKKLPEPQRNKTHWDYLLEEMAWLSKDFREERTWKQALARKCVKAVSRWHTDQTSLDNKSNRSLELQTRRLAAHVANEVLTLWGQIGRVVHYKHEQALESKRQEARNAQLDFLVGQTARYTDFLFFLRRGERGLNLTYAPPN